MASEHPPSTHRSAVGLSGYEPCRVCRCTPWPCRRRGSGVPSAADRLGRDKAALGCRVVHLVGGALRVAGRRWRNGCWPATGSLGCQPS